MTEPASGAERRDAAPWHRRTADAEAGEGLLLAEHAVRIGLKNRIIVDAAAAAPLDATAWADEARSMLGRLRAESEMSAGRMSREREVAERSSGRARHQHDYRARDALNLDRRREVYRLVAERLQAWEGDRQRVAQLLAAARADAAAELDAAIGAAQHDDGPTLSDDEGVLRQRLALIAAVDLRAPRTANPGDERPDPQHGPARRLLARLRRRV